MWQPPGADETTTRLPHADDSQADTLVRDAYIKRLGLKMADGGHASWGTVRVLGKNVDAEIVSSEASFACLAADTELNLVAELLKANWRLRPPSVLLSVTGSAQDMALEPHLELLFKRGLAESARSTNAWVITGGTDSGVMALAGAAIAENSSARGELTPCIGIAPFRCVTGKDKLHGPGAGERTVSYRKVRANSTVSAALDPHHTHFLLVDNDKTPGFGGEIRFRTQLEERLSNDMRIPKVLLVLSGGKGTVEMVAESVKRCTPVVLVKESGGAAQAIAEFLAPLLPHKEQLLQNRPLLAERTASQYRAFAASGRLGELMPGGAGEEAWMLSIGERLEFVHCFALEQQSRKSFDAAVMDAIVSSFTVIEDRQRALEERKRRQCALAPLRPRTPAAHSDARSQKNSRYPTREEVPDARVAWERLWPEYAPTEFTDRVVLTTGVAQGWADPESATSLGEALLERTTYCAPDAEAKTLAGLANVVPFDSVGRPRNPRGRTGITGRGLLGKWGPNHAADPIVTRFHPYTKQLQVVAIQRRDTGAWALPGGMVDAGEAVSQTVRREFQEEAGALETPEAHEANEAVLNQIFAETNRRLVYRGYVDDPRNTDNAWMETTAYHFHCRAELVHQLRLAAGDDAGNVTWLDVDPDGEPRYANLYADHRSWVDRVAHAKAPHMNARTQQNPTYPHRAPVHDSLVPWSAPWTEYSPVEFTHLDVRSAPAWADTSDASGIHAELCEKRLSYESPIEFDDSGRPRNPRGRTGITGRGLLGKWGPNHAADPIVTRFHPYTNQLQVVAIQRQDTKAWGLPGGMADAGDAISPSVASKFRAEAGSVSDYDREVFSAMLDELFDSRKGRQIYRGYVDDPRNTDNAWLETTAVHFHCSRRLASRLRLEAGGNSMTWLDIDIREQRYADLYASHRDWVDRVQRTMAQKHKHPQLLQLVVRWNRRDIAERVLTESKFREQRQPLMVQDAFEEALVRANSPHFDVSLVELLLDHGASSEEVFLGGCGRAGGGLIDKVVDDRFDFFRQLSDIYSRRRRTAQRTLSRFRTANNLLLAAAGEPTEQDGARWRRAGDRIVAASAGYRLEQARASPTSSALGSEKMRLSKVMAAALWRERGSGSLQRTSSGSLQTTDEEHRMRGTPWRIEYVNLMTSFVPGYDAYAGGQQVISLLDLIFWAIACGAFELAFTLWRRCRSPLRAALLAQCMCSRIKERKRTHIAELERLEQTFCKAATGVLDMVEDQETARMLLQSVSGPSATLGVRGDRRISTIDLAIELNNKEFIAHRYCQGILDEMWLGRDARCGRVQLWRKTSPWQILLQIVCPCLSLVRLKRNDLFPDLGGEGRSMSAVHAFTGLWYIPAVKRMVHLVSLTVFAILTVIVTLMPTCAPLGATFYCWAVYLVAYIMQECQQFLQGPSLWWRNMYNKVDAVLIVFLLAMAMMRVVISLHGNSAHTAVDLLDWIGQMQRVEVGLDLHVEAPLRPGWPWHAEAEMLSRRLDSEHQCSWSVALELYRTTAAVVMVFFAFRMLEWFTNDSEKGVLIEIISRMVDNLWHWIQIMVIFTLFIAIAMSILMENFKLTDAEEGIYLFGSLNLDLSAGGPFMAPFWGIFGFYEPADIARAPGSAFITPLIFWSYLLFALLLMTNLLIAMFNDTYVSVKAKSTEHFLMNRVLKLKGYLVQYVVPIPFNMPYMLWDLMWQGVASLGAYCRRAGRRPNAGVLGIKQTRVGIEPVQDLEKPLASPPKKVCFDLADDNEAANGNGAPRPLQRQGTLGRLEASRKLLRQNTRRQLATVRAVKNVRKEASTSVARSVDLTEAHARDRYLKQREEEGATAADFSQLEVRLRRLEGALTAQLRELASQLEARPALPPRASGACAAQTPPPREMQSAVSGDEMQSAVVAGSPLMRFRRGREPSHRSPPPPPPPRPFL